MTTVSKRALVSSRVESRTDRPRSRGQRIAKRIDSSLVAERGFAEAARVFGLTSFVVAGPLLDVFGANPTFFVAHDIDGTRLVLFAVALVVIPPMIPIALLWTTRLVARRALPIVAPVIMGSLLALALVPTLDRREHLSTELFLVVLALTAIAGGFAYRSWRTVRSYATFLAPAPILFLVVFLFASPASTLIGDGEPAATAAALNGARTPVVVVAFDELPLGVLMDDDGTIAERRFPAFARLAATSTWYRHATTVAPWTHLAVPAILTGQMPSEPVPVASAHPRSLFTLLGRSHKLQDGEVITHLCPKNLCGAPVDDDAALVEDSTTVYLHSLLPDSLAEGWLPPINDRWSNFDEPEPSVPAPRATALDYDTFTVLELLALKSTDETGRYAEFLRSIDASGKRPGAWFQHTLLPHLPYQYLGDGRRYNGDGLPGLDASSESWRDDVELASVAAQRLAIQTAFVDRLLSGLLDRLTEQGVFDDALVIVTADHGMTFAPGRNVRGGTAESPSVSDPRDQRVRDDVLPVPLFVKYPGQSVGEIDARPSQVIDVLPTIVDALDIPLPRDWSFDGRSLLESSPGPRRTRFVPDTRGEQSVSVPGDADATQMATFVNAVVGSGGDERDLYRLAPYGDLVGRPAGPLVSGPSVGTMMLRDPNGYENVALLGTVPALFDANVTGVGADDWVAVALNGVIAGTGPVYKDAGALRVTAMLDPSLINAGHNSVDVYRIDRNGAALQPLR